MAFTRDEIKRIRKYAQRLEKLSMGRPVRPIVPGVIDDTGVSPPYDDLKQQRHEYLTSLYDLIGDSGFAPIRRLIERELPGKIPNLLRQRDVVLSDIKRQGSIVVVKNLVRPDASTWVGIRNFCDELTDAANQGKDSRDAGYRPAELDILHSVIVNLQGFLASAPKGQPLPYERVFKCQRDLIQCFHNWAYVKKWLREKKHKTLVDKLEQRHEDVMDCIRRAVAAAEESGPVMWPNNLKPKIVNLIRQIEVTIGSYKPKTARETRDRFTFNRGQVLFDDKDLELATGFVIEVAKRLHSGFGETVSYGELDGELSQNAAEEPLRGAIRKLRATLEEKGVPCQIVTKTREGYCLCEKIPESRKPRKQVTQTKNHK